MEGSVLSFLKAEWKVSDTGSAHLASIFFSILILSFGVLMSLSAIFQLSWRPVLVME